jgi:hypothetical protein
VRRFRVGLPREGRSERSGRLGDAESEGVYIRQRELCKPRKTLSAR